MLCARFVKVDVHMRDIVMSVLMKMEITSFAERLGRGADAQTNDHERNGEFKKAGKHLRDDNAHGQHETSDDRQGYRVARTPQAAHPRSMGELAMFTDDR